MHTFDDLDKGLKKIWNNSFDFQSLQLQSHDVEVFQKVHSLSKQLAQRDLGYSLELHNHVNFGRICYSIDLKRHDASICTFNMEHGCYPVYAPEVQQPIVLTLNHKKVSSFKCADYDVQQVSLATDSQMCLKALENDIVEAILNHEKTLATTSESETATATMRNLYARDGHRKLKP